MIQLCLRYGLDPVSTGGTIAWAMKAFDKGLLQEHEMEGITLHWGDGDAALKLIPKIAEREGIGDTLAEGTLRASRMVGHTGEELVTHVKGLELIGLKDMNMNSALHAALSTGDWDHLKNVIGLKGDMKPDRNDPERDGRSETESIALSDIDSIARTVKRTEDAKCAADLAGVCSFPYAKLPVLSLADVIEQLSAVTGLGIDKDDLINSSEKTIEAERHLAAREGVSRREEELFPIDKLPSENPEARELSRQEWGNMLSRYYALRNWESETGLPNKESRMEKTSEVLKTSEI
jgi:aldehyde:ferredoxin oxidoreductase